MGKYTAVSKQESKFSTTTVKRFAVLSMCVYVCCRPLLHRSYSLTTVAMATESVTDVLPLSSSAPAPSLVSLSKKSQEDCAEPSVNDVGASDRSETQPDDNTSTASVSSLDSETSGNQLPRNNGGGLIDLPSAIEITEGIEQITGTGILPNSLTYPFTPLSSV